MSDEHACARCSLPVRKDDARDFLGDRFSHHYSRCVQLLRSEVAARDEQIAALTAERDAWIESAREYSNGLEFYRDLVWKVGDMFGVEARTSDDGSIQDDVLALKVPKLVERTVAERDAAREALLWRTIENAPKDGTRILLAKIVGHPEHETALWWATTGAWSLKWERWWDCVEPCGLAGPTHWMAINGCGVEAALGGGE